MDYLDDLYIPNPYQQQIDETNIDYKRFLFYKDLGARRSLKKVSAFFGVSDRRIAQISVKNHWVDRLHAINKIENDQIISTVLSYIGETARDLANDIKPVLFDLIAEIAETPKNNLNPTELKGLLDVCYKIIAQIYGMGNPQVQVTNVEVPQINMKWDWEDDGEQDY
jgi:hypothetical protein|tara:strand:+ start:1244 stop:1744 length:501 start_codon:yes stop_codon:yes gene_type:complete